MSTVTVGYTRRLGSLGIYEGHETALGLGEGGLGCSFIMLFLRI